MGTIGIAFAFRFSYWAWVEMTRKLRVTIVNDYEFQKSYPQRCAFCDRIGFMEDTSLDKWTCTYCGKVNKYNPTSRFVSNGKLPYVECMCRYKIPITHTEHEVYCPQCAVRLIVNNAELHVSGEDSAEVLDVLNSVVDSIGIKNQMDNKSDLRWERFAANMVDCHLGFENLCRDLFREEYFDNTTTFHLVSNNPGIEVHPLRAKKGEFSGRMISFQSKYFSGRVNYSNIQESAKKIIKYYHSNDTVSESIDVVILYCNQLISQSGGRNKLLSNKTFASTKDILNKAGIELKVFSADELLNRISKYPELVDQYFFI